MRKKMNKPDHGLENTLYVLVLRKCWGLLLKKYGNDNGRKLIIQAKYDLAKCPILYMMMKSFCNDDSDRWSCDDNFQSLISEHYFYDTVTDMSFIVSSLYYQEKEERYLQPDRIHIIVNDDFTIEFTKHEKIVYLKVLDTMRDMRHKLVELEATQRQLQLKDDVWNKYA